MAKVKEEVSDVKVTSKGQLDAILKNNKSDHYNYHERVTWKISTGSFLLDSATGGLSPMLLRLCGTNNSGKTPCALEIIRQFLTTVPNAKAVWVIAEGRGLSPENVRRCGLKFVYDVEDWDVGTVFVLETNIFELFVNTVKTLVKDNPENNVYAFVVDSLDGLMLKSDAEKDISENNKVAGVPALSKKMLQSLSLGMFKFGHLMVIISQVTAEIKLDPYTKSPDRGGQFSGGNSLLHGSDFILEFQSVNNGDFILDDPNGKLNDGKSTPIGRKCRVIIQKSGLEASKKKLVEYPIKFGKTPSGVWVEAELSSLMLKWGLIMKRGGWFNLESLFYKELVDEFGEDKVPEKIQGEKNIRAWLEESPDIVDFLMKKFRVMIDG